jgi:predicted nucleotide-binding protein
MPSNLLPSEQLELALYRSIEFVGSGQWRPCIWGQLSNQLGQPEQAKLLETLKRLHGRNALEIQKWFPEQQRFIAFAPCFSENDFFFRGDFRLRVAPEGRPYFESLEQRELASTSALPVSNRPEIAVSDPRVTSMNLTSEQLDLLRTLVGVYKEGCRTEFLVTHTHSGSSLVYAGHSSVPITADDTDFERLAQLDLVQLGRSPRGDLRGKPTAAGLKTIEELDSAPESVAAPAGGAGVRTGKRIFIGHGRSEVWRDLKDFLAERLKLDWDEFNREPAAGYSTAERLKVLLEDAGFAFLVFTAEDEREDGTVHARENVVHEAGLFQGRLGFNRAIILMEEGCAEFSNIHGLTQIRFPRGNIMAASEEIRRVLERESIL